MPAARTDTPGLDLVVAVAPGVAWVLLSFFAWRGYAQHGELARFARGLLVAEGCFFALAVGAMIVTRWRRRARAGVGSAAVLLATLSLALASAGLSGMLIFNWAV